MYSKNIWENINDSKYQSIMGFCEGYKDFLTKGKTERLCVAQTISLAEKHGFVNIANMKAIKTGDKVYVVNKGKNIALFVIGSKPLTDGLRILGAHIDSPRLDLKQNPVYEKQDFALLNTHYYGGIKKYQWVTIPLSLIGVVVKKDGTVLNINIGEDEQDPVFGISDLLIHLAGEQLKKNASDVIDAEALDITCGNIPLKDQNKDAVKANILKLIKEKYQIDEEDFLSAELEAVPNWPARDLGFDRSMVSGYGQDDRVCAYTSLMAILDITGSEFTSCCILVDKEEIGSVGATGAKSVFFENAIAEIMSLSGNHSYLDLKRALQNSKMLSSDVSAAFDPLYPQVFEEKNSAYFSKGVVFNKYTGSKGKSGSNDAEPEYVAWIREILDKDNICYQTSELGKVDIGGGGTIAYILANYNMNVLDAGIPVLSMHAPMEITSKADIYEAYLAYKVFLTK